MTDARRCSRRCSRHPRRVVKSSPIRYDDANSGGFGKWHERCDSLNGNGGSRNGIVNTTTTTLQINSCRESARFLSFFRIHYPFSSCVEVRSGSRYFGSIRKKAKIFQTVQRSWTHARRSTIALKYNQWGRRPKDQTALSLSAAELALTELDSSKQAKFSEGTSFPATRQRASKSRVRNHID